MYNTCMSISINFGTERKIVDTGVDCVCLAMSHVLPRVREVGRLCMAVQTINFKNSYV